MRDRKTSIFLVDDHPLVREWLGNLLHQQPDLAVCGEAENAADAHEKIGRLSPDVAIIDISLPGSSGIDLIRKLKATYPALRIIVLSMHDERVHAERALRAGASGYVMKRETAQGIVASIRKVLEGKLGVSEMIAETFAAKFVEGRPSAYSNPTERLSEREIEIFRLLGQGCDTRNIALKLNISIKTVQTHCARMKEKLALNSATELLREAMRWSEADSV